MANITNTANNNIRSAIYGTTDGGITYVPITSDANGNMGVNVISGSTSNQQYTDAAASPTHSIGATLTYVNGSIMSGVGNTQPLPVNNNTFLYKNITTGTTTTVKSGAGFLNGITINTPVASATITLYDNTSANAPKIGTITLGSVLSSDVMAFYPYEVAYATGLTVVTSTTTDITVSYM